MNFGSSVSRSITELNTDSHTRSLVAIRHRKSVIETPGSCGLPACPHRLAARSGSIASASLLPSLSYASKSRAYNLPAAGLRARLQAFRAEFISVNGLCPVRSAPRSDMRQSKRISGDAAATVPPHAPMNSPVRRSCGRVSFSTIAKPKL